MVMPVVTTASMSQISSIFWTEAAPCHLRPHKCPQPSLHHRQLQKILSQNLARPQTSLPCPPLLFFFPPIQIFLFLLLLCRSLLKPQHPKARATHQ